MKRESAVRLACAIALLIPLIGPAGAQTAGPEATGNQDARQQGAADSPQVLRVRPSGVDALTEDARARQDRLEARMRRNEFLFRNICRNCSRAEDPTNGAPFEPLRALRPGAVPDIE